METVNVRDGTLKGQELSLDDVKSRLGKDIELRYNPIYETEYYRFINIKNNKSNNRFSKKNIKRKLERLEDYDLELLIENNEVNNLDELVDLIYKTNYKSSRKSNYDVLGVRLANHSKTANYGDNNVMIIANLIFDTK